MNAKHTPGPWTLVRMEGFDELHKLRGTKPEEHEGYFRTNDGSWAISNPDGRICLADFKGKAKRGEAWKAPDPEGMANARLIAAAPELLEALKKVEEALKKDSRGKTITGDSVEYHLDGQEMYHAINLARAAIARAEGGR